MLKVDVRQDEPIEAALRRFKHQCEREGLMREVKKRQAYESPSVKRKHKAQEARRRARKKRVGAPRRTETGGNRNAT